MSHIVHGRPDFQVKGFGWTTHKPKKEYVFGKMGQARLIHRVVVLRMHWYDYINGGSDLMRLDSPNRIIAECVCGMSFFIEPGRGTLCEIPAEGSVPCGKCNGMPGTFSKHSQQPVTSQYARDHVGCAWEAL